MWGGTAQAATDWENCASGRARAQETYEQCVQNWLAKNSGPAAHDSANLAKCQIKYAKAWNKLAALATAPCSRLRYVSTATTVTDNLTWLVWEKKATAVGSGPNGSDRNDVDISYTWTTGDTAQRSPTSLRI